MNVIPFDMLDVTVVEYRGALGTPKVLYDLPANRGRVNSDFPVSVDHPRRGFSKQKHIIRIDSRSTNASFANRGSRGARVHQSITGSTIGGSVSQIANVGGNVHVSSGRGGRGFDPQDLHDSFVIHLPEDKRDQIEIRAI